MPTAMRSLHALVRAPARQEQPAGRRRRWNRWATTAGRRPSSPDRDRPLAVQRAVAGSMRFERGSATSEARRRQAGPDRRLANRCRLIAAAAESSMQPAADHLPDARKRPPKLTRQAALTEKTRRADGPYTGSVGDATRLDPKSWLSRSTAESRPLGLVRALPALAPRHLNSQAHRPSTPSAAASARARTTRSRPARATPAARGPSARPRAATRGPSRASARSTDFARWSRRPRRARHRGRPRHRLPVLARPPLGEGAPGVVPPPARRHHPVRREPAQEVPGHLPARLRDARTGAALWDELRERLPVLDRAGRPHLPRRQPAHQALRLLGVGDREVQAEHPDVIFLAEAFTRPKVMYRLAKLGFTQSYTYFTWRNSKQELTEYFTELTQTDVADFFRPEPLAEHAGHPHRAPAARRPAGVRRAPRPGRHAVASYGIYGPAFELCEHGRATGQRGVPRLGEVPDPALGPRPADSLAEVIARVNRIRRENPALPADRTCASTTPTTTHLLATARPRRRRT